MIGFAFPRDSGLHRKNSSALPNGQDGCSQIAALDRAQTNLVRLPIKQSRLGQQVLTILEAALAPRFQQIRRQAFCFVPRHRGVGEPEPFGDCPQRLPADQREVDVIPLSMTAGLTRAAHRS
jgi:hypothetical protein